MLKQISFAAVTVALAATFGTANAANCKDVPSFEQLQTALKNARNEKNGGFDLDMWGTIVNRAGEVCAVTKTGATPGDQWPGSRVISAQKANTANAFSLPGLALSTANLYSAVQPGGSLFGLQESNPVDTAVAYAGNTANFGTAKDPLVNKRIGGVNVFGGGLALYNASGKLVGAIGVSGDSSCADHNIAWRTRHLLAMDKVTSGVAGNQKDNIIFDITNGKSAKGFGHPVCGVSDEVSVNKTVISDAPLPN
jgi:uncharacterized protein GlcG (DUF336 family)